MTFACSMCRRAGFTIDLMYDSGQRRKDGTPCVCWCLECGAAYRREWYERQKQDPERLARRRAASRESKRRKAATPGGRERLREIGRESNRRRRADPERRAEVNRRARERRAKLKAEDPAAFEALLQRERAQRAKRLQSPAAKRQVTETRRIWAALRREERGVLGVGTPRGVTLVAEQMGRLPVAPLLRAIDEWLCDRDIENVGSFLDPRNYRAWRNGDYATTPFDVADRVLIGIDLLWWEVWTPDSEGHERAAELFTGEKIAA